MRAILKPGILPAADAEAAAAILRACVHCGFCNATCPSYQVLGDERDGPRGRIYLMKSLLEGEAVGTTTQTHLDRCLGCKACETTCPSGVHYTRLLDLVRPAVEAQVARPLRARALRWLLRRAIPHTRVFTVALTLGRWLRPLLPDALRRLIPRRRTFEDSAPLPASDQHYALLAGCVQEPTLPAINQAARAILARARIGLRAVPGSGCCGALPLHLGAVEEATACARRNIDAWSPLLETGAISGIFSASTGCTQVLKDYAHILRHDATYRARAEQVVAAVKDASEAITPAMLAPLHAEARSRLALQTPCSMQHGLKTHAQLEALLNAAGFDLQTVREPHLCCGSAGTYSLLQPAIARSLLERKLSNLEASAPTCIATANIGCLLHLETQARVPVRHWLELVAARVVKSERTASP